MIKKMISIMLTLLLVFSMSAALAAPGDVTISSATIDSNNISITCELSAALGDKLYIGSYQPVIYRLQVGNAEMKPISCESYINAFTQQGASTAELVTLYSDNENLYGIYAFFTFTDEGQTLDHAELVKLTDDGSDAFVCEKVKELDWDEMTVKESNYQYSNQIINTVYSGGYLMIMYYGDMGDSHLAMLNLETGVITKPDVENVLCITTYKDGTFLLEQFDSNAGTTINFLAYDPREDSIQGVARTEIDENTFNTYYGLVYSEERDLLYYSSFGTLYAVKDFDFAAATVVSDMPAEVYNGNTVRLIDGLYYAAITYEVLAIRNTDVSVRPTEKLVVATAYNYDETITAGYYAFSNARGDLEVFLRTDYMEDNVILEGMMNRDSDVDVYLMRADSRAFDSLYQRGYMAEIKSDVLSAAIEQMYPAFRDFCVKNGEIVCFPVIAESGNALMLNMAELNKAGITQDMIPATWPEFIEFLNTLPAKLEGVTDYKVFDYYYTRSQLRSELYNRILIAYQNEMVAMGQEERGYNTKELQAALEAVDNLDFDAMGIEDEFDWENYTGNYESGIVSMYGYFAYDGGSDAGYTYISPSVNPQVGTLWPVGMYMAMINPFSTHQQDAVAFIEALNANMKIEARYALSAKDNEPCRYTWYEENLKYFQDEIDSIKQQIAETENAEDKQLYEDILKENEGYMQEYIDSSWRVSQKQIDFYQANADGLMVTRYNTLYGSDGGEIYSLVEQLGSGNMTVDEFLRQVDKKAQMMTLEGN